MNKTSELIKTLEVFYDHNHSCIMGYLMGVLKELEMEGGRNADIIASHNRWIKAGIPEDKWLVSC